MVPKNTAAGIYIAAFAFLMGFGFVWHMIWMPIIGIIGIIIVFIRRAYDEHSEYVLSAAEVQKLEENRAEEHEIRLRQHEAAQDEEEMGVIDFVRYALNFALSYVKQKRRKHS